MNAIRHLIFDLDGTLIDSSEGVVDAVNYSLRMTNQPEQPPERIKPFIGFPLSQMYQVFTDVPVAELYHHFQVRAAETVVETTVTLAGVDESLRRLHQVGYRMAIATTKIKKHTEGIIEKLGWSEYFAAAVGGDEVENVKPAPDAFALALERIGAGPEDSAVVGDTINDVLAARAVPIRMIAVTSPYGGNSQVRASGPDFIIDSVAVLPQWLADNNNGRGDA